MEEDGLVQETLPKTKSVIRLSEGLHYPLDSRMTLLEYYFSTKKREWKLILERIPPLCLELELITVSGDEFTSLTFRCDVTDNLYAI